MTGIYAKSPAAQSHICYLGPDFWSVRLVSSTAVPAGGLWKAFLAAGFVRRSREPVRESGNIVGSVFDKGSDWSFN